MSYATLGDDAAQVSNNASEGGNNYITAKVVIKFCSFGLVSTAKWYPAYIIVANGTLKVYDHEDTVKFNPKNTIMEIPLDRQHRCSGWKRKNYKQKGGIPTDFFSFYIMKDSAVLGHIRELKIGSHDLQTMENIMRCLEANTHNRT